MYCRTIVIAAVIISVLSLNQVYAFEIGTCNSSPVTWDVEPGGIGPQFRSNSLAAAPVGAFEESLGIWNANPTAMIFHPFVQIGTEGDPLGTNTVVDLNNGHNEMWLMDDDEFFGDDAAIANRWLDGCGIVEADIVYNASVNWINAETKSDTLGYGLSGARDMESATVHELGHAAGFDHVSTIYNTMGLTWRHHAVNGSDALQYVGSDVVNGLLSAYEPAGVLRTDLSVVHWRYKGTSGQYSNHEFTQLFDQNSLPLQLVDPDETEPRYIAAAGQTIQAQFTFENLGPSVKTNQQVGFYYSPDDLITTLDQKIAQTSVNFENGAPQTIVVTFTLPADLPQGDGYIGVVVDESDRLTEVREGNNATYLPIKVDGVDVVVGAGGDDEKLAFRYAAKFVCGVQSDSQDFRLVPGVYATTVNIFNPNDERAKFDKSLSIAFPPATQSQGTRIKLGIDELTSLHALKTDCNDIRQNAFEGTFPTSYVEGFVVITSPVSLDVSAVYTNRGIPTDTNLNGADDFSPSITGQQRKCRSQNCGCANCCQGCCFNRGCDPGDDDGGGSRGRTAGGISIDVEQIRERVIEKIPPPDGNGDKADLIPVPGPTSGPFNLPETAFCQKSDDGEQLLVTVRNQGAAQAQTSVTTVTYFFDKTPILRATATLGPAGDPIDEIVVPFPFPKKDCFVFGGPPTFDQVNCPFEIQVDSGPHVAESNEGNNTVAGVCSVAVP